MTLELLKKILEKYGKDKCVKIILDNARDIYITVDENGDIANFDSVVTIDEDCESLVYEEKWINFRTAKNNAKTQSHTIVTPIENIQGLNFVKAEEMKKYFEARAF